ncbi:MAG: hypothetical protein JWP78_263 [Mucilaginibacter sp.]|nr:hypothetical protein [Mucilaginibacter sp.]
MKTISLGVVAILLAGATVYANGPAAKIDTEQTKKECQGRCLKASKSGTCKDANSCPDMKTCGAKCS